MDHLFNQYGLHQFLIDSLKAMHISKPTEIQGKAIPLILQGKEVLGQSQTGTGKTLAYLLPILQSINDQKREVQALIIAPTRELTNQIFTNIGQLITGTEIDSVLLLGGVDINKQIQRLKRNPHIVVGTPGRVADLIANKHLSAHSARFLVIDEADTMLDMGFREDVEKIAQGMKHNLQRLLFSATLPPQVVALAKKFMKQPVHVSINPGERTLEAIKNIYFKVKAGAKDETLIKLIKAYNPFLAVVFVKRKEDVDKLVASLCRADIKADGLQGDMQQNQRKQVMKKFRDTKIQVLVATDIASRGLDVEGITHVLNYDLPISIDQYIHRIGRTGRAGETGVAVSLIYDTEEEKMRTLAIKLKQPLREMLISGGEITEKPKNIRKLPTVKSEARAKTRAKGTTDTKGAPRYKGTTDAKGAPRAKGTTDAKGAPRAKGTTDAKGAPRSKSTTDAKGAPRFKGTTDTNESSRYKGKPDSRPGARSSRQADDKPGNRKAGGKSGYQTGAARAGKSDGPKGAKITKGKKRR